METIVQWNAGMSSACFFWAARKMIRLPCLCAHRNMNVITSPYPIYIQISGVYMWPWDRLCVHVTAVLRAQMTAPVCTCDRGMACVYMWPPFCVRRWPYGTKKVSACTCDLDLRARMTPWPLRFTLHTSHLTVFTLHTTHFTLHSSHCTLHTKSFTQNSKLLHKIFYTQQAFTESFCTEKRSCT